jgi:hypothetical protein
MVKDGCPEYCPCPALVLGGSEWSYSSDDGLLDVRFAATMSSNPENVSAITALEQDVQDTPYLEGLQAQKSSLAKRPVIESGM